MASKEQDKGKIGKGKKITVRGVVRDVQATPIEGVRIYSVGNEKELAVTNKKGEYVLKQVAADDVLIVSKAGHESRSRPMEGETVWNCHLYTSEATE